MFIDIEQLSGIVAATLFIFGLKRMSSPVTALSGIKVAGIGMVFAIAAAFLVIAKLPAEASGRVSKI
ncbi:NAD(P)(+) transhydrogenase (Re/Si-specific) subunit beta [Burkholderia gladioli]|uniref:NAD(P)(+) transhydrogenase (Re/Si-specific) subunit beta n=1 Tax=Burkholderia gladioli TaxID=28095 RepID=UPI0034DB46E6